MHLLLGGFFNRRLIKLENKSPSNDNRAKGTANSTGKSIMNARMAVADRPENSPRQVFEQPNNGCPSDNIKPPSIG
jgi:hypothetical protein